MRSATGTAERDAVPMLLEPAVVSTDSGRSAGVICLYYSVSDLGAL